jgi:hypothetical protein
LSEWRAQVDSNGGRSWWAHLADTRINIELTFLNDEKAFEAAGFTDVKTVLSKPGVGSREGWRTMNPVGNPIVWPAEVRRTRSAFPSRLTP